MASTNVGSVHIDMSLNIDEFTKGFESITDGIQALKLDVDSLADHLQALSPADGAINALTGDISNLAQNFDRISGSAASLSNIAGVTKRAVTDISVSFDRLADGWSSIMDGMGSSWDNTWDGIVSGFSSFMNRIIDGINNIVKELNRIQVDMPPGLGAGSFGFDIPTIANIPALASGGIVQGPTLALVGERGKEAVLPLENNTGWINDLAAAINQRGTGQGAQVNLYLERAKIAEAIIDDIYEAAEIRGYRL